MDSSQLHNQPGEEKMAMLAVSCPACQRSHIVKAGKQPNGVQRYRCQNPACTRTIFQLAYVAQGRLPETQRLIVEMALNGSGIRDTARVLRISPKTVIAVLKNVWSARASQPCTGLSAARDGQEPRFL